MPASALQAIGLRRVTASLQAMTITATDGRKYRKTLRALKRYATAARSRRS